MFSYLRSIRFAQNQTIDLNMTDKPLSEIFKSIENKPTSPLILTKRKSIFIKNIGEHQKQKLTDALSMILSPLKYKYAIQGKHVIITNEKTDKSPKVSWDS